MVIIEKIKARSTKLRVYTKHFIALCHSHKLYVALIGVIAVLAAFGVMVGLHRPNKSETVVPVRISAKSPNLISGQDWSHFAGAIQTIDGVHIEPLGRAIVNQDGSGGQPNPPVNVRGPHLLVSGDFKITYRAQAVPAGGKSSFYLYGSVPIIYDEWRMQTPQLQIDITHNAVNVQVWDGRSDVLADQKTWDKQQIGANASVTVSSEGNQIFIGLNGQKLGSIGGHDIFKSDALWFGADAIVGTSGWILSYLAAESINGGQLKVVSGSSLVVSRTDPQALRNLADVNSRKIPIGAVVANYALFSDPDYRKLVATQFSMLTPENELKPQFVHPQPDVYTFAEADSLVDFARANNMKVHGHTLVFSEANPKWMQDGPLPDRQKIMTDHISTVMQHFGTKINEWDVVNEPLSDDDESLRHNIWFAAMGENYIDIAFKAAKKANPSAKLYMNEYGLEADGSRWDEFVSLVKRLQARGVPLNGIGFQAHVHEPGDEIDIAVLESHMQVLAGLGLKSRISEIDVYGDNPQHQADQYAAALQACLDAPSCTSFTSWGVADKYGSTTDIGTYPLDYGNDLIWDFSLRPKPAYARLQNVLRSFR